MQPIHHSSPSLIALPCLNDAASLGCHWGAIPPSSAWQSPQSQATFLPPLATVRNEQVPLSTMKKRTAQSLLSPRAESSSGTRAKGGSSFRGRISVEGQPGLRLNAEQAQVGPCKPVTEQRDTANAMTPSNRRAETFLPRPFPHTSIASCGFHADTCVETAASRAAVGFRSTKA